MQRRREDACIYAVGQGATGKPSSTMFTAAGPEYPSTLTWGAW